MIMRIIVIISDVRAGCRQCNIVMSQTPKNALVPAGPKNLPVVRKQGKVGRYNLGNEGVRFKNREEVRERLPDILGKALAMIWIDKEFADGFARDPQKILEAEGIILPENMAIEFQKPGTDRPRIVVYEKRPNSNFRLRVLYLHNNRLTSLPSELGGIPTLEEARVPRRRRRARSKRSLTCLRAPCRTD